MKDYHVYEAYDGQTFINDREACLKHEASLDGKKWQDKFTLLDADCDYMDLYSVITEHIWAGNVRYIILKETTAEVIEYIVQLIYESGCRLMAQDLKDMRLPERNMPILAWDADNEEWYDFMEPYEEIVGTFKKMKNFIK